MGWCYDPLAKLLGVIEGYSSFNALLKSKSPGAVDHIPTTKERILSVCVS